MKVFLFILVAVLTAVSSETNLKAQTITGFTYASGPTGSYVAKSKSGSILPEDGWIFTPVADVPSTTIHFFLTRDGSYQEKWSILTIRPENDELIEVGSYTATRFGLDMPGLLGFSWSYDHQGLNTSTSFVEVLEVTYSPEGVLTALAVDFTQYEETWGDLSPDPATRHSVGSFRYNSTVPFSAVPEPTTTAMLLGGLMICFIGTLRKKSRGR